MGAAAQEQVLTHAQGSHRLSDLGFPDAGESGTIAFQAFEVGGDDLAVLTTSGTQDRDPRSLADKCGDCASGRDRLIIGMSVHEEDAGTTAMGS